VVNAETSLPGAAEDIGQVSGGIERTPATPEAIQFVDDRLHFFIKDYKKKRNRSRDLSNAIKFTSISLGGLVTVLIGLKPLLENNAISKWLPAVTLILSAFLTSLGAWEAFADHRWKWIRYRATLSSLYTIQEDFCFRRMNTQQLTLGDITEYYTQMRNAVHETNQEWMSQRGNSIGNAAQSGKGGESK
jgi:hypothetical protein